MPIQEWSYRNEAGNVRHVGPTAQDFRAAFGLGTSDEAIALVDIDGVNMLAVQTLTRRANEQSRQIETLRAEHARQIEALRAENARLVARFAANRARGELRQRAKRPGRQTFSARRRSAEHGGLGDNIPISTANLGDGFVALKRGEAIRSVITFE